MHVIKIYRSGSGLIVEEKGMKAFIQTTSEKDVQDVINNYSQWCEQKRELDVYVFDCP